MTIILSQAYATYAKDATVDLDNATEASLVAQGRAAYSGTSPGAVFYPLTTQEQQNLRDGGFGVAGNAAITASQAAATTGLVWAPQIPQAQHLRNTAAKIGNAGNSPVVINCLGHSLVDGGYANDAAESVDINVEQVWGERAFPQVLQDLFATNFGTAAGLSICQTGYQSTRVTKAGTASATPTNSQGFGGSYISIPANAVPVPLTNYISVAGYGSIARVRGLVGASAAQLNYSVDGIASTTVLAQKASTVQSPRTNGFYWYEVDIPLGAVGSHTLYIQQIVPLTIITDIRFISDATKGVYVGRYGMSGKCLTDMIYSAMDTTDTHGPARLDSIASTGYFAQQLQSVIGRSANPVYSLGNATSITNASPAVVNFTAHGLNAGDKFQLATTNTLPAPLLPATDYYAMSTGLGANAFQLSRIPESQGGLAINTTTAGAGTHSVNRIARGFSTDLAIIMCDANDSTQGLTYGYGLADVQRHAQNAANAIVALGADVLFVTGPSRQTWPASWSYAQNIAAYKAVADATDRVAHLDLSLAWTGYDDCNTAGLMYDYVHLTAKGHAWVGKALYRALMSL